MSQSRVVVSQALEPHVPVGRLEDGSWLFVPVGRLVVLGDGELVVCHACGASLAALSAAHVARHGLTLAGYRERFGLNRKASLVSPVLAQARREEGRRRWAGNEGVRAGLGMGQEMARSGALYELGARAQPKGARRAQGRVAASRDGASPTLVADRARRSVAARARWDERARQFGFACLEAYLMARREAGASTWQVRRELGCGGDAAAQLLRGVP